MQGAGSDPRGGGRTFWDLCSNLDEGRSSVSGGGEAERVGWLTWWVGVQLRSGKATELNIPNSLCMFSFNVLL